MDYRHTQKIPDKAFAIATFAGFALGLTPPGMLLRLATWGLVGTAIATFRALTVIVDDENIKLVFGDGLIKKSFPLKGINTIEAIRTSPIMGWGIHWVGTGWLFNIYGLDAIEITYESGKKVFIGTDEPHVLVSAIQEKLSAPVAV